MPTRVQVRSRVARGGAAEPPRGRATNRAQRNEARRRSDLFDAASPGGQAALTISRSGKVTFAGAADREALVQLARSIENGGQPFRRTSREEQAALLRWISSQLPPPEGGKQSAARVLERSAAATSLLSLAGSASPAIREQALAKYVDVMAREKVPNLQLSMLVNLDASRLSLSGDALAKAARIREEVLPRRPPYDEWFRGNRDTLEVKHYVMDDFWRSEVAAYRQRGFTVVEQEPDRVVVERTLVDPSGENKPVKARVTIHKGHENVFRDMEDPNLHMLVYSGHAQLGGVVTSSLAQAPKGMAGTKLVQMYSCRGKQTAGEILSRFPRAHLTTTESSAYGPDDKDVLDQTFKAIAARGSYSDIYRGLCSGDMIQPRNNYILPHDARLLLARDTDDDGLKDLTPIGPDRFYDPARARAKGGALDLKPAKTNLDPQRISGDKLDHAVSYANTAFFYFAEENRAAPIAMAKSDTFLAAGWFQSPGNEPIRVEKVEQGGKAYYKVAVNSRYSHQSREAITAMVLMEMQRYLCLEDKGRISEADQLRGLMLVGGYADLFLEYAEDIEALLAAVAERYGFAGVSYEVLFKAGQKDGDHGTATPKALEFLRKHVKLV